MTEASDAGTRPYQVLVAAASCVVIIAGVRAAASLVVPFLTAAFIAIVCSPALHRLRAWGVPTWLALLVVVAAITLVLLFVVAIVWSSIDEFLREKDKYAAALDEQKLGIEAQLRDWNINLPSRLTELANEDSAMNFFVALLSSIRATLSNAFLVLLTVIFILLEASDFPQKLIALHGGSTVGLQRAVRIRASVMHYVSIKTVISLATGILVGISMKWLNVPYPFLWGMLAFFFNFVPTIGSFIAAVPATLMALIAVDMRTAFLTAIAFVVINVTIGNIIEPRIMGRGLGLSTLVVLVSLVFWGWALGMVGMLLSVPLTMVIKIALESSPETRGIAILLGSDATAGANS